MEIWMIIHFNKVASASTQVSRHLTASWPSFPWCDGKCNAIFSMNAQFQAFSKVNFLTGGIIGNSVACKPGKYCWRLVAKVAECAYLLIYIRCDP